MAFIGAEALHRIPQRLGIFGGLFGAIGSLALVGLQRFGRSQWVIAQSGRGGWRQSRGGC